MKKRNIIVAAVIIVVVAFGFFGKAVFDEVKVQMKVDRVLNQVLDEKVNKENIDYSSLGKYGDSVKEVIEDLDKFITDAKHFEKEANNEAYEQIMAPKYLKDPVSGKKNLQELSKSILSYEELFNNDLKQLSESLEKLPMGKKDKEELRKTIETGKEDLSKEIAPTTAYLKEMFAKHEVLFDFLIQRKGKYSVEGDGVCFDSQQDVKGYNKLIDDLNNHIKSK